jgi:hypothetical protein
LKKIYYNEPASTPAMPEVEDARKRLAGLS